MVWKNEVRISPTYFPQVMLEVHKHIIPQDLDFDGWARNIRNGGRGIQG